MGMVARVTTAIVFTNIIRAILRVSHTSRAAATGTGILRRGLSGEGIWREGGREGQCGGRRDQFSTHQAVAVSLQSEVAAAVLSNCLVQTPALQKEGYELIEQHTGSTTSCYMHDACACSGLPSHLCGTGSLRLETPHASWSSHTAQRSLGYLSILLETSVISRKPHL